MIGYSIGITLQLNPLVPKCVRSIQFRKLIGKLITITNTNNRWNDIIQMKFWISFSFTEFTTFSNAFAGFGDKIKIKTNQKIAHGKWQKKNELQNIENLFETFHRYFLNFGRKSCVRFVDVLLWLFLNGFYFGRLLVFFQIKWKNLIQFISSTRDGTQTKTDLG